MGQDSFYFPCIEFKNRFLLVVSLGRDCEKRCIRNSFDKSVSIKEINSKKLIEQYRNDGMYLGVNTKNDVAPHILNLLWTFFDTENKVAIAVVKNDSLSVAIGKKGVNVLLAAKLTGYKIDVKELDTAVAEGIEYKTIEEIALEILNKVKKG